MCLVIHWGYWDRKSRSSCQPRVNNEAIFVFSSRCQCPAVCTVQSPTLWTPVLPNACCTNSNGPLVFAHKRVARLPFGWSIGRTPPLFRLHPNGSLGAPIFGGPTSRRRGEGLDQIGVCQVPGWPTSDHISYRLTNKQFRNALLWDLYPYSA